jgi:hypothetical protein
VEPIPHGTKAHYIKAEIRRAFEHAIKLTIWSALFYATHTRAESGESGAE